MYNTCTIFGGYIVAEDDLECTLAWVCPRNELLVLNTLEVGTLAAPEDFGCFAQFFGVSSKARLSEEVEGFDLGIWVLAFDDDVVNLWSYAQCRITTLLNALTGAGILAEDKLFATLDPTTRQYVLPSGMKILLTDTVGFIRNLPHHLIKAFRSTLEEAALADVILHVCDASGSEFADELKITDNLLTELGASGKPVLLVFLAVHPEGGFV